MGNNKNNIYNNIRLKLGGKKMEDIRDKRPMIIAVIVAVAICVVAYYFLENYQPIYYTRIDNTRVEKISATDDMKYEYTLDCYNEKGKKKEIKFKTSRELRESAYLMLETTIIGVHSWKEIEPNELPDTVTVNYLE